MIQYFRNLWVSRHIISYLVKLDLKSKYRNSILGFAWNLLTPLGMVAIIGVVYATLFKSDIRTFVPYLFSGLTPWFFILGCADGGCHCFLGGQGYIKQISIPLEIFPIRTAIVCFVNMLLSTGAYIIACIFINPSVFSWRLILLLPAYIIYIIFGISWATITGYIQVYIRDYAPFQSLAFQALLYVTPIMYPAENLYGTSIYWIVRFNPFRYLIDIVRSPLLGVEYGSDYSLIFCIALAVFMFIISLILHRKIGRKIVYRF